MKSDVVSLIYKHLFYVLSQLLIFQLIVSLSEHKRIPNSYYSLSYLVDLGKRSSLNFVVKRGTFFDSFTALRYR